jgi:hypothetical protein
VDQHSDNGNTGNMLIAGWVSEDLLVQTRKPCEKEKRREAYSNELAIHLATTTPPVVRADAAAPKQLRCLGRKLRV